MEPLHSHTPWGGLECPDWRGVLISGCWNRGVPLYTEVSSFQGVGIEGFHCEVSSFQEVGMEGFHHCIHKCPLQESGMEGFHCIHKCPLQEVGMEGFCYNMMIVSFSVVESVCF